jgi:hypothetical protein
MRFLVQLLADRLELVLRWLTDDAFLSGNGQCLRGICNARLHMAARLEMLLVTYWIVWSGNVSAIA